MTPTVRACVLILATMSPPTLATTLLQTSQSWDGGELAYPGGQPEITAVIMRLEAGQQTPWHCHPVPTMGYMLSGELAVETSAGKQTMLRSGDAVSEVMNTVHRGSVKTGPVEIVVFYAGSQGQTNTLTVPIDQPDTNPCSSAAEPTAN